MKTFKDFGIDLSGLSENEREMVEKLTRAGKIIATLYDEQKEEGFYPSGVTAEEIEVEAEKNEDLLHPYTFVGESMPQIRRSRFKAVFFSSRFKQRLKEASKLIGEAAGLTEDEEFKKYLKEMGSALLKNEYGKNEVLWVNQGKAKFNFIIGPIERYLDKLLFKKSAYQAWLGITDERATEEAHRFRDIILASRRKILPGTAKINSDEPKISIDRTIYFSGLIADNMFTGTNLPGDPKLIMEHGSRMVIFQSSLDVIFRESNYPIIKRLFEEKVVNYFSEEEIKTALLRAILLHEITHTLVRYETSEERLKDLFPVFDELTAYIFGMKLCDSLLLKDVIDEKGVEAIMTTFIAKSFRFWKEAKTNSAQEHYARGGVIAINFFLEEGALKRKKSGCMSVDFSKLFISIARLSRILEYYLASGSYEEAQEFLKRYSSEEIFERCEDRLFEDEA